MTCHLANTAYTISLLDSLHEVAALPLIPRRHRRARAGVAVQNVERSRTLKVSGSCQRLAVHVSALWSLCREMARTRAR